ncbi:hypothetical protein V6N13_049918 [Hibiscus sabdariffa]|uniref:Uncharacterized protein n=1 Tax=Hibiscus sabdariffa TaxID=183260 RepID=A0ABR2QWD7_9ROSI
MCSAHCSLTENADDARQLVRRFRRTDDLCVSSPEGTSSSNDDRPVFVAVDGKTETLSPYLNSGLENIGQRECLNIARYLISYTYTRSLCNFPLLQSCFLSPLALLALDFCVSFSIWSLIVSLHINWFCYG